jgi:hypothetical protein
VLRVIRFIVPLLALGASFLSVPLFMANTDDERIGWVVTLWLLYLACGLVIGACIRRWWFVAVVVAWFPLLLLSESWGRMQRGNQLLEMLLFISSPAAALIGAYLGFEASRRWSTPIGGRDAA